MAAWAVTEADVKFKAGCNVLVFKVLKQTGYWHWQGSIHFTDSAGKPINGIRVTLTPP